jgi:hypothetical protein
MPTTSRSPCGLPGRRREALRHRRPRRATSLHVPCDQRRALRPTTAPRSPYRCVANGMYGLISWAAQGLPPVDRGSMEGTSTRAYHGPGCKLRHGEGDRQRPTYVLFSGAEGSLVGDNAPSSQSARRCASASAWAGEPDVVVPHDQEIFDRVYQGAATTRSRCNDDGSRRRPRSPAHGGLSGTTSWWTIRSRAFNKGRDRDLSWRATGQGALLGQATGQHHGGSLGTPPWPPMGASDRAREEVLVDVRAVPSVDGAGVPDMFPPLAGSSVAGDRSGSSAFRCGERKIAVRASPTTASCTARVAHRRGHRARAHPCGAPSGTRRRSRRTK